MALVLNGLDRWPATGDASAQRIVVKYPSEGGYQPGDTWDLYLGADKRIEEIAYHRGAVKPPHFVTGIYTDYKGWPTPDLNGSPWDGGRQTLPDHPYGCVGQVDGLRQLDQRAMNLGRVGSRD